MTLGPLVAGSTVSVVEYELGEPVSGANVEENHSWMDDWGADAGGPSPLSPRGTPDVVALSDVEDDAGTDLEERATSPVRRREDVPISLMYQHPRFVAGSTR